MEPKCRQNRDQFEEEALKERRQKERRQKEHRQTERRQKDASEQQTNKGTNQIQEQQHASASNDAKQSKPRQAQTWQSPILANANKMKQDQSFKDLIKKKFPEWTPTAEAERKKQIEAERKKQKGALQNTSQPPQPSKEKNMRKEYG